MEYPNVTVKGFVHIAIRRGADVLRSKNGASMHARLRTTLTLDDDLAGLLQQRTKELGIPFKEAVNRTICAGPGRGRRDLARSGAEDSSDLGPLATSPCPGRPGHGARLYSVFDRLRFRSI